MTRKYHSHTICPDYSGPRYLGKGLSGPRGPCMHALTTTKLFLGRPGSLCRTCWGGICCYNRQGRKAKDRRSRENHSNRGYTRTQTVRNTGTYNQPLHQPLHLTRATSVTNDHSTVVFIGDLSPWRHLAARSPGQEVSTTTIHRPLTLDQRHAEFPMCTSQKRTSSHCRPTGSYLAYSVQVTD